MYGHPEPHRRLLLLRHAKSDWETAAESDHDRPLAARGKKDAVRVGRFLSAVRHAPDHVVTSSALRAHDTVSRAAEAGAWSAPIEVEPLLYMSDPVTIIERAREAPGSARTLLLAGHEPASSALVTACLGGGAHRMPTAAVACIHFAAARWTDLAMGRGSLAWLITPKLLRRCGL